MPAKTRNLLQTIAQMLGKEFTLTDPQFKLLIQGTLDGGLFHQLMGNGGAAQGEAMIAVPSLVVPATDGTLDADIVSGTATLVASTVDVTVTGGVPVGSTVYATVETGAGTRKELSAVRLSATQIRISSPGSGFGALLSSASIAPVLVAGTVTTALANVAGDVLAVLESAAGGAAADHFSVVRVSDANIKVQAHDAAGALVAGNTSTVRVYNFGQAAHETSTVRWVVVRP
jgi:hypothetical protein